MDCRLTDLRRRIESLADADGQFVVACVRSGERPVPVAGRWFPDRERAARAARLATDYRDRLRAWDPRTARYDLAPRRCPGASATADPRQSVRGGRR